MLRLVWTKAAQAVLNGARSTDQVTKLQEMSNTLRVAIHKAPSKIELAHWAFHARVGGFDMIYQVIGGDGEPFEYNEKPTYPERSGSHASNVAVSTNVTKSIDEMREILKETKINNADPSYNCQKWVLDGLKNLRSKGAITEAEYDNAIWHLNPLAGKKGTKHQTNPRNGLGWAYEPY